ncbi:MAG TPA: dATP pyrophosphohydrolase [Alphaproteobacteria bacterium]|jgi:hypothetical protein
MRETPPIVVRPVGSPREREIFLRVPEHIFAGDPAWVPPLHRDERCKLAPGCHPFFDHGRAAFWIAWRGDTPVGRISAQINELAARPGAPLTAHFGMLDAVDDAEVFAALTGAACEWARADGAVALEGPYSLSLNEEFGVLIDGFEAPPVVMMAHTRPYYLRRLEALGFVKAKDFHHQVILPEPVTLAKMRSFFGRIRMPEKCTLRHARARTLRRDFHLGMRVYNAAWRQQWGFLPVTDAEVDFLADRLRFIFDPKLMMLAEREGEVIALCCCIPDYNEATRDLGGRLLPFGWLKLAWRVARRRIKGARLILIGVDPRYHKTPGGAALHMIMVYRMIEYLLSRGYRALELAWMSEDNRDMLKLAAYFGARHRKTYRVLILPLI